MSENRTDFDHSILAMALKISLWNAVLKYESQDWRVQEELNNLFGIVCWVGFWPKSRVRGATRMRPGCVCTTMQRVRRRDLGWRSPLILIRITTSTQIERAISWIMPFRPPKTQNIRIPLRSTEGRTRRSERAASLCGKNERAMKGNIVDWGGAVIGCFHFCHFEDVA